MADGFFPTLGFVKLCVRDLEVAMKFYDRAFGLAPVDRFDTDEIREVVLRGATHVSLILFQFTDERPLHRGNMCGPIGFRAPQVDTSYDHAVACGATSCIAPANYGAIRAGFLRDPDGHEIEIVGPS